jgi:vitamin B12 transporter
MTPAIINTDKSRFITTTVLSLLCLASPARSQDDNSEEDVYDLKTMVIVANRSEVPINQVGSTVELLDAYDLNKTEQAFLLDSIRHVPGFYLRNNGSPGGAFGITTRGLNGNHPTVLVDGIEIDNPATGQIVNFGSLFGDNVSRVEILKGPQSSLYGANALAGVISIRTEDGKSNPGSQFGVSYGAHDTLTGNLSTRGAEGNLSWALNLSYYEHEFSVQNPSFGPEWEDADAYDNFQSSVKIEYAIDETSSINFLAYWFDTFAEFDPGDPDSQFGAPELINFTETTQFFSRIGGAFQISENWDSTTGIAINDADSVSVTGGRFPNDGDRYTYDWKNTIKLNSKWTLVNGIEHEEEDNRSGEGDRNNTSLFVENIIKGNEVFNWTIGGRYDDNSVYGEETTWRTTFSYQLEEANARIRGSYGTSFQAPSFFQLFSSFGDPNIKPESGEGWDIGYEQGFADGKVFLTTTLFGNKVKDKIIFSFNSFTFANEDIYKSQGVENALRFQIANNASATLAYTYSDANYENGTEAGRVPRNILSLGLDFQPTDKVNITTTALTVSSQYSTRTSTTKQDGYTVVNVAGQYDLDERMQLWLRIDNLLDEDYEEVQTFQTSGVSVYSGVRFNF